MQRSHLIDFPHFFAHWIPTKKKNKPTHSQPIGPNLNRIIEHVFHSHFQSFQHYKWEVWEIEGVESYNQILK